MILKSVPRPSKEEGAVSSKPVLTELETRRPGSVSAAQWGATLSLGAGPTTTMTNPEKDEYRYLPLPQTYRKAQSKLVKCHCKIYNSETTRGQSHLKTLVEIKLSEKSRHCSKSNSKTPEH